MKLLPYQDADYWLTEELEIDPAVMHALGGPVDRARLPETHRQRNIVYAGRILRCNHWMLATPSR